MRQYNPEGTYNSEFIGFKRETLYSYMNNGTIVQAPAVKCDDKLNLYIDLGPDAYGTISFEDFEYNPNNTETKSIAVISRVTKLTCFKVIDLVEDENGRLEAKLSRKEAQKECYDNYISKLRLGQVIDARISHIENYGAFCDIGCGFIALLPIEHFCTTRIRDPKTSLRGYRNIKAVVRAIDENGRITLSHKELLGTWEEEAAKFKSGEVVAGTVRLVEDYGIFVELTPNLAGLAEVTDDVEVGDTVSVFIKSIIPDKMKVKLIIVENNRKTNQAIRLNYRVPESGFVTRWVYSPINANKLVETVIVDEK